MQKSAKIQDEYGEIEVIFDDETMSDLETIDMLASIKSASGSADEKDRTNAVLMWPAFIEKIFGQAQKKRIYDHFRDENGRVPIGLVSEFVMRILQELAKKN